MKVAMIGARGIGNRYSGIETHLEELCPRLVRMGHEVTVFARSYFTKATDYHGVKIVRLPTIKTKHLDTLAHSVLATIAALWMDVDVVHFHALGPSVLAPLPLGAGKKVVATVHGLDWQRKKWGKVASWCLKRGEYASASFPTATIAVSKTLQAYYQSRYPRRNIYYIPNGVSVATQVPPNKIRQFGLDSNNYILFVGRLTPEKGCHLLVDAYKSLSTNLKLVVAGGSAHTDSYARSLQQSGNGQVVFLGAVGQDLLAELYSNAYVFVLPSLLEGLSICLLEAMSYGLCVVASDIPPNLEVIEQNGIVFSAGDQGSLAHALSQAIAEPASVAKLGSGARERIRHQYDWDSIAAQTASVYTSMQERRESFEPIPREDQLAGAP